MCRKNKTDVVRALLTLQDIDVNACCNAGWTPLHEATISGNIDILDMLLSYNPGLPSKYTKEYLAEFWNILQRVTPLGQILL